MALRTGVVGEIIATVINWSANGFAQLAFNVVLGFAGETGSLVGVELTVGKRRLDLQAEGRSCCGVESCFALET